MEQSISCHVGQSPTGGDELDGSKTGKLRILRLTKEVVRQTRILRLTKEEVRQVRILRLNELLAGSILVILTLSSKTKTKVV